MDRKSPIALGDYDAAEMHRVDTQKNPLTTSYGDSYRTGISRIDQTYTMYVESGALYVASQENDKTIFNISLDASEETPGFNVAFSNTGKKEAFEDITQGPDSVDKFYRYIDALNYLDASFIARPKPSEGIGDKWTPKPYRQAIPYDFHNDDQAYQRNTGAGYTIDGTLGISFTKYEWPFLYPTDASPQVDCFYQGARLQFLEVIGNKRILSAYGNDGKVRLLVTRGYLTDEETEDYQYDYYNNYINGSPNSRTEKVAGEKPIDYALNKGQSKNLVTVVYDYNQKSWYVGDEIESILPIDEEILNAYIVSDNLIVYVSLLDNETVVRALHRHADNAWYDTDLYAVPSMTISDILSADREPREIRSLKNLSSGTATYTGGIQCWMRKSVDHQEINIEGKRVISCNVRDNVVGLLIEDYKSTEITDVDYPRRSYGVGLAITEYPRSVLNKSSAGLLYSVDINYGGKAAKGTYNYTYERDTSYSRVLIDLSINNGSLEFKVTDGLESALKPSSIRINEESGHLEEGRPKHIHLDDGDSFTIYQAINFSGVDLGAVTDYNQDSVVRTESIIDVPRVYACDPISDSYYISVVNAETSIDVVVTDGNYIGVFHEYNDDVMGSKEDVSQLCHIDYWAIMYGQEHHHYEYDVDPLRSLRVMRRYLGDPVDYQPMTVPYNYIRNSGLTTAELEPWSYDSGQIYKNFSRDYSNVGILLAHDLDKLVITTNVSGVDLLQHGDVKSYACAGFGESIVEQLPALYAPITIGVY